VFLGISDQTLLDCYSGQTHLHTVHWSYAHPYSYDFPNPCSCKFQEILTKTNETSNFKITKGKKKHFICLNFPSRRVDGGVDGTNRLLREPLGLSLLCFFQRWMMLDQIQSKLQLEGTQVDSPLNACFEKWNAERVHEYHMQSHNWGRQHHYLDRSCFSIFRVIYSQIFLYTIWRLWLWSDRFSLLEKRPMILVEKPFEESFQFFNSLFYLCGVWLALYIFKHSILSVLNKCPKTFFGKALISKKDILSSTQYLCLLETLC